MPESAQDWGAGNRVPPCHRVGGEAAAEEGGSDFPGNTLWTKDVLEGPDDLGVSGLQKGEVAFCREER